MRVLIILISFVSHGLAFLSRLLRKGSGTSIAGWFIEKWFAWSLSYFQGKYKTIIYISGTNGKTTTRQMVVRVVQPVYKNVVSNFGGANILRGVAASLFRDLDWMGNPKSECAVLEVEEATLPRLSKYLQPTIIVLTNLARDQLDAYGELDVTLRYFQSLLRNAPNARIILNNDDPMLGSLECSADIGVTLMNSTIEYENATAQKASIHTPLQVISEHRTLKLHYQNQTTSFVPLLLGEYNAMNYGLAAAVGCLLEIPLDQISSQLQHVEPVFGRGEQIVTDKATHRMVLVKNPLGFTSALKVFEPDSSVLVGVQDKIADGRDVSWLWDVEFEQFPAIFHHNVYTSGIRSGDITLRLQQASRFLHNPVEIVELDIIHARDMLLTSSEPVTIYGTYTFCMELRSLLAQSLPLPPIDSENF